MAHAWASRVKRVCRPARGSGAAAAPNSKAASAIPSEPPSREYRATDDEVHRRTGWQIVEQPKAPGGLPGSKRLGKNAAPSAMGDHPHAALSEK